MKIDTDHRASPRFPPALSMAGFAIFMLLTGLVQVRLLTGVDLVAAAATRGLVSEPLDALSSALSILFSGELSLFYALIASLLLWRRGLGRWSYAPLLFVLLVPLELVMKLVIQQPPVPLEFHRYVYYPLTSIELKGSFPSGHAIRSGFLCAFAVVLLLFSDRFIARVASLGVVLLAALIALTRVYLGNHWLSDVAAGLVLGASLAYLVAPPIARLLADHPGTSRRPG